MWFLRQVHLSMHCLADGVKPQSYPLWRYCMVDSERSNTQFSAFYFEFGQINIPKIQCALLIAHFVSNRKNASKCLPSMKPETMWFWNMGGSAINSSDSTSKAYLSTAKHSRSISVHLIGLTLKSTSWILEQKYQKDLTSFTYFPLKDWWGILASYSWFFILC